MIYASVDFDRFTDPAATQVSVDSGDSFKSRLGLSIDRQAREDNISGDTRRTHVYGLVNLIYEWLDGTRTEVSGTRLANRDERLWAELGVGGSYNWGEDRFTLYTEISVDTAVRNFGDSYSLKGTGGFRWRF